MSMVVIHVGKREVADLLFIGRLGRFLSAASKFRSSVVLVHDGLDGAESVVENAGLTFEALDASGWAAVADDVFRSVQDLNRRIVNSLSEEGVPAIGFMASDRGFVGVVSGTLECLRPDLVKKMTVSGSVLVLGPVVQTGSSTVALESSGAVAAAVANSFVDFGPVGLIHFSAPGSEKSEIDTRLYNTTTYEKSINLVLEDTIRPEILADSEFWERFS